MAADGRVTQGPLIITDMCKKIRKLSDGALFALTGSDYLEENLIEWLEACEPDTAPPQGKDFTAILVDTNGNVTFYEGDTDRFLPWFGDFAAFGSGSDFAYGALEMGATAEEAVAVAIRRNHTSGGHIQIETPGLPEQDTE